MKEIVLSVIFALMSLMPASTAAQQKVVNASVLLNQKIAFDSKRLIDVLKTKWKVPVDSANISDKTLVFNSFGGSTVMIAYLDYPVATDEAGAAARLSWLWRDGAGIAANHQAHIVISVIGPEGKTLDLYKIMTQTTAAVLEITGAPAVFQQAQYLLLEAGYFINAARNMVANQSIPAYCWVYFGRPGNGNGFTYGLSEFGLQEMEIVQSANAEPEVHATLYDAVVTRLKYPTIITDGQTFVTEEGTRLIARIKTSTFFENQTVIQLDY